MALELLSCNRGLVRLYARCRFLDAGKLRDALNSLAVLKRML